MANLDGLAVEFCEIVVRRNSRNVDKCVANVFGKSTDGEGTKE